MNKKLKDISNERHLGGFQRKLAPFGFGNLDQLAGFLNPFTQNMKDQEDAENNQNADDTLEYNGTRRIIPPSGYAMERTESDGYYGHFPGFPRMNSLEKKTEFIPKDQPEDYQPKHLIPGLEDDEVDTTNNWKSTEPELRGFKGDPNFNQLVAPTNHIKNNLGLGNLDIENDEIEPEEYPMRSTPLDQLQIQTLDDTDVEDTRSGMVGGIIKPKQFVPTDNGEEDKRLQDLVELTIDEAFKSKKQMKYFYWKANKKGKEGKKWKKMADEFSSKTKDKKSLPDKV